MAAAGASGEVMKRCEKQSEGSEFPINEQRWEEELEERRRVAKKIVIASMDMRIDKKKVIEMLRQKLGRKIEEVKVEQRAYGDGITRWHAKLESTEEAKRILAEEAAIRREHKIKVSPESTYFQRQTRFIVERRADKERSACKEIKIKTGEEIKKAERRLEKLKKEEEREAGGSEAPSIENE